MKRNRILAAVMMFCLMLCGCTKLKNELRIGTDTKEEDIRDFYYTFENINYNASYQRYRFYTEDGKHMFFHETRERKDDYGPATEKDTTAKGSGELSEEEWKQFVSLVNGGTAEKRKDDASAGSRGPWMYIYLNNDVEEGRKYLFPSLDERKQFETFCEALAEKIRG